MLDADAEPRRHRLAGRVDRERLGSSAPWILRGLIAVHHRSAGSATNRRAGLEGARRAPGCSRHCRRTRRTPWSSAWPRTRHSAAGTTANVRAAAPATPRRVCAHMFRSKDIGQDKDLRVIACGHRKRVLAGNHLDCLLPEDRWHRAPVSRPVRFRHLLCRQRHPPETALWTSVDPARHALNAAVRREPPRPGRSGCTARSTALTHEGVP